MSYLLNLFPRSTSPVADARPRAETTATDSIDTCPLSRDLTKKILLETVVQSVKNKKRDYHDVIDSLAIVCPFWRSIVRTAIFDNELVEKLKREDPSYPYRLTSRSVPVDGADLDAANIIAFTVMQKIMYVVHADDKRSIKMFSVAPLKELDTNCRTVPLGTRVKATAKHKLSGFLHDIYWLGSCDATKKLYAAMDVSTHPPPIITRTGVHEDPGEYEKKHKCIITAVNVQNYEVKSESLFFGLCLPQIYVSPHNGHIYFVDRYTMVVYAVNENFERTVLHKLQDTRLYPPLCMFFRNKVVSFMPYDNQNMYLVGHQHPNCNRHRWCPLGKTNSSFRLTKIRYDPVNKDLGIPEARVVVIARFHKNCSTRVHVVTVTETGDVIILLTRAGQKNSLLVQLDSDLNVQRYIGVVDWSSNVPGLCTVDHTEQRLYVITNCLVTSTKAWRSYRPPPLTSIISVAASNRRGISANESNAQEQEDVFEEEFDLHEGNGVEDTTEVELAYEEGNNDAQTAAENATSELALPGENEEIPAIEEIHVDEDQYDSLGEENMAEAQNVTGENATEEITAVENSEVAMDIDANEASQPDV